MVIDCPKCIEGLLDGVACVFCGGDGEIDLTDTMFKELAESDFRSVNGKLWVECITRLDAIIAEQASMREDLTTALEAIWNKVKNLE